MAKSFTVVAEVHKQIPQGYRVKISLPDLGMYINGAVVQPPNEKHDEWWFFAPAQHVGHGRYLKILEFNRKMPLWQEISEASVEATKQRMAEDDFAPEDIPDTPISFDNIDALFN